MDILIGIAVFLAVLATVIWQLKVRKLRTERRIDAAYTKPNKDKYTGYWHWPKSPDI